ncbi:importin-9 [Condylostylus longicornis]|uniref:importin-9 n=1 Tax=Condylostylus longicornis TaxID=2530218 RepID=UPI00244E0B0E|nr:importin-9 [Condylostylus longicornis]
MSLSFQNADSIKQALYEELQNVLNPDADIRNQAEARVKQLEFTEGYGVYLTEFIMNQSFDISLRQLACIMLTKYVENHWSESNDLSKEEIAGDQAKKTIRNILPNGLYDPNSKIRSVVAQTISAIANVDYPGIWTELFDIIIKCLGGNENSIHGAMQVLVDFPYEEKQIKELGPVIISEVYRIFESEQQYSVKTRTHAIKILKPLFSAISYSISNKQEQAQMMENVLRNFMTKLIYNLSVNPEAKSNFVLKTEIVKILTFLVSEMPKYIHPFMNQILPPIWQLLTQTADLYVKVIVNGTEPNPFPETDDEDDELTNLTTMIIQIFEFIQCVIGGGKFRPIIKNVLTDLMYIMVVYIQVSEEQIEMWEDDPEKFVEDEDDAGVDLTIRLSGQDVLTALNDEFGAKVLPSLSEALVRHMNVAEAEKGSGNQHWWKIHEASMVAVHTFKDLILENETHFNLLNYLTVVRNLLNFQSSPYLIGRCLWTLSAYSQSSLYNVQLLDEILDVTLASLSRDRPIVLKICAVRAIHGFVDNIDKNEEEGRALILSKLLGFVDGILDLITGCKSSVLALLLEALTTIISFDNNFAASVHSKIIPLTIAIFLKYPEDPFILEIVQDMLKALSQNPLCLQPLQEKIIPTLVSILNLQGEMTNTSKQDIALDVLTTIVKYSQPPLSDNLIENAFPAVVQCVLRSDDHSVMVSGGECLRAYIAVSPEQVCSYKNGEGLNYIMQVTTMLLNPMNNEMTASQIGRLVITIITKMGNILGENIDLLLKAVISKMQLAECLKVIMSLIVIFAHLFLTQMDAVLNFLTTVPGPTGEPAIHFVISNWLAKQNLFFGSYERKVTIMALCKLFEYGVTTQDNRLISINIKDLVPTNESSDSGKMKTRQQTSNSGGQVWITIPALVKVFKLLINELGILKEAKQSDNDSDSWTDDEEDESGEKGHSKQRFVSDLYFNDDDDENADDDQLMQELIKDPLFQADMEINLTKFLQNFSNNTHFQEFCAHLNESERNILRSIDIQ